MAKVIQHTDESAPTEVVKPVSDTFTYTTTTGSVVVCGRPRGVLKLRLRAVLTKDQISDPEILELARAVLSIRSFDGAPPIVATPEHFEIILARFGDDESIDGFMNEWQRFMNPEVYAVVQEAVKEGTDRKLYGDKLNDFVAERVLEISRRRNEDVKN